ncbi:MAG: ATP phosphoribosyltransferase regulatory subunit [Rhizobiaceae bacterium]
MFDDLLGYLRGVASDEVNIEILQPADPFLETAGEDLRRRIFITETVDGIVHCLRPEFTIPICLAHLANGNPGKPGRYAYGGAVFRQARSGANEFQQAGLEDLGNSDRIGADVASLADMIGALKQLGIACPQIVLGDQNLFAVVVESLQLPQAIARRLVRNFGAANLIEAQIQRLTKERLEPNGEGDADRLALAGNRDALISHIEDKMRVANLAPHSGRSPQAIAERLIDTVREQQFQLSADSANILRRYLALQLPLGEAPAALQQFGEETGLSFGLAGKEFFRRVEALQSAGLDLSQMSYKASLGRNLEYYTGVLFEAATNDVVVAGGGRYDRLCSLLGAQQAIPAVGFSVSLDRVEEAK